jgi:hypothetical protein
VLTNPDEMERLRSRAKRKRRFDVHELEDGSATIVIIKPERQRR